MRQVEPFLEDPEDVRKHCPTELRPVLDAFLAIRAMKTACVLAYWGQWQRAAALRRRFQVPGSWKLPWFLSSWILASPLGAIGGKVVRRLK
jgi:hypothetical protein